MVILPIKHNISYSAYYPTHINIIQINKVAEYQCYYCCYWWSNAIAHGLANLCVNSPQYNFTYFTYTVLSLFSLIHCYLMQTILTYYKALILLHLCVDRGIV